jgi:hypothetical protein
LSTFFAQNKGPLIFRQQRLSGAGPSILTLHTEGDYRRHSGRDSQGVNSGRKLNLFEVVLARADRPDKQAYAEKKNEQSALFQKNHADLL